ncbi:MAG: hypothetical protein Q4A15_08975 [Prevotellaceae bacterium]|nr:hypothetical protein [Prevotellaceae bacterium]
MIEFDIEEIKESIQDLSDNDKLKALEEKETEIYSLIEELEDYLSEISELREEIKDRQRTAFCNDVQNALKEAGYNIPWDDNGNLTIELGGATITIMPTSEKISVYFTAEKHQLSYRKIMSRLFLDYKQDGNFFSLTIPEKELIGKLVDTIKALTNAEGQFSEISGQS